MIDVDMWADIRCPWCWVGLRRLYAAIRQVPDDVRVHHHSFLLEPEGPATPGGVLSDVAVDVWGMTKEQWTATSGRITAAGRGQGLTIRIDTALTADSRTAHRLMKLAAAHGVPDETAWNAAADMHLRRNRDLADPAVIRDLGREIGLHESDVESLLAGDDYLAQVMADHREARARGVESVPTVVVGDRMLPGSRSVDELVQLLSRVRVGR